VDSTFTEKAFTKLNGRRWENETHLAEYPRYWGPERLQPPPTRTCPGDWVSCCGPWILQGQGACPYPPRQSDTPLQRLRLTALTAGSYHVVPTIPLIPRRPDRRSRFLHLSATKARGGSIDLPEGSLTRSLGYGPTVYRPRCFPQWNRLRSHLRHLGRRGVEETRRETGI